MKGRTLRVGDLASGRAGDKGATLDLSIVADDRAGYELLAAELTGARGRAGARCRPRRRGTSSPG